MKDELKIAVAQINPTVGDITGNSDLVRSAHKAAEAAGADLVVFGELVLCGYPPEDLVLKGAFQDAVAQAVHGLAAETADGRPGLLLTAPWRDNGILYNAAFLLDGGEVAAIRYKHNLPNYGVFDEKRVFASGSMPGPINFRGVRIGVPICEDIWTPDVCECLAETGAEIFVVPNSSPFEDGKFDVRLNHAVARVTENKLPLIYVNQVGGQDELVFDGGSFVLNSDCELAMQMPTFRDGLVVSEWRRLDDRWVCGEGPRVAPHEGLGAIYRTMTLGLRDYVNKNRFPGVVLGLSGGIDSALSAAVAVDALGPGRVWCVTLPSKFSSDHSLKDARDCAEFLQCRLDKVPIEPAVSAFDQMLEHLFERREPDITEENIQSRARGMALMAISNKFGHMVLTTGNKSEMSVGYATIYGDMCGGFSVLKDVYKITAFELARWRNQQKPEIAMGPDGRVIPENTIVKPPSAELRLDQKDEDSLPPYEVLDDILRCLVEEEMSFDDILSLGHDLEIVRRIEHLLYLAEYKRRQAPPGVKITARNFGRDRRYPITNGFRNAR